LKVSSTPFAFCLLCSENGRNQSTNQSVKEKIYGCSILFCFRRQIKLTTGVIFYLTAESAVKCHGAVTTSKKSNRLSINSTTNEKNALKNEKKYLLFQNTQIIKTRRNIKRFVGISATPEKLINNSVSFSRSKGSVQAVAEN